MTGMWIEEKYEGGYMYPEASLSTVPGHEVSPALLSTKDIRPQP